MSGNTTLEYFYRRDLQGDVIGIVAINGASAADYCYDAWGRLLEASGPMAEINPIRYRGYYYDAETGLYYVSSRYYDPEICRWINADDTSNLGANNDFASLNLFAYCGNNPVNRSDPDGTDWRTAFAVGFTVAMVGLVVLATLPFSGPLLAGIGVSAATVATAANATVAAGLTVETGAVTVAFLKGKTEADPYGRAGQKKQGRELKSKSRLSDKFQPRNNRRDKMPAPPKHHTPAKEHQKFTFFYFDDEQKKNIWWVILS